MDVDGPELVLQNKKIQKVLSNQMENDWLKLTEPLKQWNRGERVEGVGVRSSWRDGVQFI